MKLDPLFTRLVVFAGVAIAVGCASEDRPTGWGERCPAQPGEDGDPRVLDFEVTGHGLETHDGAVVRLLTYQWDDPARVLGIAVATIVDGSFTVAWPNGYQRFSYQPVIVHVDSDGDGRCDPEVELGKRFVSNAWNPIGDRPLSQDVTVFPLEPATAAICADVDRCGR